MKNKLLSICIPVYNRKELFKHCLIEACEASKEITKEVEIIISDNASEEDLQSIVEDIRLKYETIDITYHKNNQNIGLSKNFLKVVDIASGKYCWIIGSDDFIKSDGIKTIIEIINQNNDVNFISCNYDYIFLDKVAEKNNIDDKYFNIHNKLQDKNLLVSHKAPVWSKKVNKLDEIIDPLYNNVLLGAVMTNIFKRSLWNNVDKSNIEWDGFNSFESMYPHCYIFANTFIGKQAFYCGKPVITVGEGAREWATDTGNKIWESSIPLIDFSILGNMVESYEKFGLESKQYYKCKKWAAEIAGNIFLKVIFRKYIFKKYIKNADRLNVIKVLKAYSLIPNFYKGIVLSIIRGIKRAL